jgi:hypothetical protein
MFKITIKSQQQGEFWLNKETQIEVDEYLVWAAESKHWGSPQWIEQIEEVLEVKDDAGVVIIPAQAAYQIVHPAEYEIIVEDISAQIAAEQAQLEAVQAAQQQAGMRLMLFPSQVDECQDLDALKLAIKQFVSDVAVLLVK